MVFSRCISFYEFGGLYRCFPPPALWPSGGVFLLWQLFLLLRGESGCPYRVMARVRQATQLSLTSSIPNFTSPTDPFAINVRPSRNKTVRPPPPPSPQSHRLIHPPPSVRRTKLFKSSSPPPPSTPNGALHLDFDFITVAPTANPQPAQPPSSEDLDFQLFSTAQKITLKDPTPPPSAEDAWELQAQLQARPATYYVLTEDDMATRRRELQFVEVVVSAEEIMRGAKIGWVCSHHSWTGDAD